MKTLTIKYDPITGAQMTETTIYPSEAQDNAQLEKARRAFHSATKHKNEITKKRVHSAQHKRK